MDYNAQKQQHKRSKRRWNFIGLMLLLSWLPSPIGVGILIANRMDILPDIGGKADVQKTVDELTSELHGKPVNRPVAEVPEQKKRVSGMPLHGGLIAAIGGILAAACALPGLIMLAQFFTDGHALADLFVSLFFLSGAAGGVMMAISGKLRRRKKARFEAYLKLIGDKQTVPIHYLADVLGIDYKRSLRTCGK